jgi:ubiquinone/menaquinone biosynthesis C-methylase UbiE
MLTSKNNLLDVDFLIDKVISADNEKIADLGCGSFGYFVFPIAKRISRHGKVYAVDILKSNLDSIKSIAKTENLSQVETIWSNLEIFKGTKISNDFLDGALLINTLHQSKKYLDILRESARMLKLGARLLVVEWNEGDFSFARGDDHRINKEELKKEAEKLKLEIIEDFPAGHHHYGLLFVKK